MRTLGRTLIASLLLAAAVLWFGDRSQPVAPASEEPPAAQPPVILALGNSLTFGWGVTRDRSYPAQLQELLDQHGYRYRVVNAGVAGDTTAMGLERVDRLLDEHQPAIVIVELGANDGLQRLPVAQIRENLAQIIARSQAAGARVVLAGMMLPPQYGLEYTNQFRKLYPELAAEHEVTLVPFFLDGVAGRPDLNQSDGVHPTGEGYTIIARNLFETLKPLLDQPGSQS